MVKHLLNHRTLIKLFCFSCVFIFFTISSKFRYISNFIEYNEISNEFRLNPEWSICGKKTQSQTYLFLAFVVIAPHQFEQRNHIRNTWASKYFSSNMKVIFTVAISKNQTINKLLLDEFNLYKDILQIENLIDSYYNCTIKIMKTFKWITKYCSNTQYILKLCDDVVVNTPELINNFKNLISYKTNHIYGYGIDGVGPIRDPSNKWYVSEKEFNETSYVSYIQGSAYILTTDLAFKFYEKYLTYHPIPFSTWLDDVYMGMLGKLFNTTIINIAHHFNLERDQSKNEKTQVIRKNGVRQFWFILEYVDMYYYWNLMLLNSPPLTTNFSSVTKYTD